MHLVLRREVDNASDDLRKTTRISTKIYYFVERFRNDFFNHTGAVVSGLVTALRNSLRRNETNDKRANYTERERTCA